MEEKKVIDLTPLGKWKRILMFLGDYGITFIISFILFNLAILPLGRLMTDYEKKYDNAMNLQYQADSMLINNGIVFANPDGGNLEDHIAYTFEVFLSYYVYDEAHVSDTKPQLGHREENEVIKHYYVDIKGDSGAFYDHFIEVNQKDSYFIIDKTNQSVVLDEAYKTILHEMLLEATDPNSYTDLLNSFRDDVYAPLFFKYVYNDITANDLKVGDESYNHYMNTAKKIVDGLDWIPTVCSFISLLLGWGVTFLLYPMLNDERRTFTMSAMRLSKIDYKSLSCITRGRVAVESFYQFIFMMSTSVFLPILYYGFGYSFNLPLLFVLSVISFFLMLISLVILLINEYNRSGSDILARNVVLPTSELDALYVVDDIEVKDGRKY